MRARVVIDPAVDRAAPYRLAEWAVFADEDVWAWGKCATAHPDPADGLKDVERLVGERGIRLRGDGRATG